MRLITFYLKGYSVHSLSIITMHSILRLLKMGHTSTKFGFVTMTNSHTSDVVLDSSWVLANIYGFWCHHAQTCLHREAAS